MGSRLLHGHWSNLHGHWSTIWDIIYWHFCLKIANFENSGLTKSAVIRPILVFRGNPLICVIFYVRRFISRPNSWSNRTFDPKSPRPITKAEAKVRQFQAVYRGVRSLVVWKKNANNGKYAKYHVPNCNLHGHWYNLLGHWYNLPLHGH